MAIDTAALRHLAARHHALLVFGAIGAANTLLHSAVVVLLVESALAGPVAAQLAGFVLANTFSFFANCRYSFRQPPNWTRYRKFVSVSLVSLALTVGLSALAVAMDWHYLFGLLLVILCGPVLTYFLHKAVTFRAQA